MRSRFGPYTPDLPDFEAGGAEVMRNVLPTQGGYRPALSPVRIGQPITPDPIIGAVAAFDEFGSANQFAGSTQGLFQQASGGVSWNDVSRPGGYSTAIGERWRFTNFGLQLIGTNFTDVLQTKDLRGVANFADLGGNPPRARYIATVKTFVVAAFIDDGQVQPFRVRWSASDSAATWPTPGTDAASQVQSGQQDLPGDFGHITGLVGSLSAADGVVFQERGLTRMSFDTTGRFFFLFDTIEGGRGTIAPGSIVQVAGVVFYLGEDGFYQFNGVQSRPIGAGRVDQTFFDDIATDNITGITATADPRKKVVYWAYPSRTVGIRTLVYSWDVDEWSDIDGYPVVEMTQALTPAVTLDDDLGGADDILDSDAPSLDSPIYQGGAQIIGGFDSVGYFLSFEGDPLTGTVQTGENAISMEQRTFLRELWPDIEGAAQIKMRTLHRNQLTDNVVMGGFADKNAVGFCPQRVNDRYMRFEAEINPVANQAWRFAKSVEAIGEAAGRR